jgi:hypothetical protein
MIDKIKADKQQIKMIHILKSKLALNDEEYREHVAQCNQRGIRSSKDMTRSEAQNLLWRLTSIANGKGIRWTNWQGGRKKYDDFGGRDERATPLQMRKIEAMWKDVSYMTTDEARETAFRKFMEKRFHVSDIRFVTQAMVHKIIKTLEAMKSYKEAA